MELMFQLMLASRLLFNELEERVHQGTLPQKRGDPLLDSLGHLINGRVNVKAF